MSVCISDDFADIEWEVRTYHDQTNKQDFFVNHFVKRFPTFICRLHIEDSFQTTIELRVYETGMVDTANQYS